MPEFAAGTDPTDGASLLRISMPIDVKRNGRAALGQRAGEALSGGTQQRRS